jgi:Ca2+-binding EF-hand superfamily protein
VFTRFVHRPGKTFLLFAMAAFVASAAFAQNSVMVNEGLLMDDDMLTTLDTDSSGLLSSSEYSFFRDRLFGQNQINHDNSITADEYAHHASDVFVDMDADHDGFLTRDELIKAHMDMLRMMYKNAHALNIAALADAMLARMDIDHDGKISAKEYADAMKARFNEIDTSQDGTISRKEFETAHHLHKA